MAEGTIEDVLHGEATWCVAEGECVAAMAAISGERRVDAVITDPPYSEQVHKSVRSAKRSEMPDVKDFKCRTRRVVDLGFEHMTDDVRESVADQVERLCKRWVAIFSDVESCHLWRGAFVDFDYIRTAEWRRIGGAPQFTGDRPASGFEAITLMHPKGRKKWNGGGKAGSYEFPIVANRKGQQGSRLHPTQKPVELMMALVADFTDPGDIVLDPFCGSGSTGEACLVLGRRFVGIERMPEHVETARQRLAAVDAMSTIQGARAGQVPLFHGSAR